MDQRIPTKAIYESNHEKYGVVVTSSKGEQVKNEYTTILNQNSQQKLYETKVTHTYSPLHKQQEAFQRNLPIIKDSPVRDQSPIRYGTSSRIIYDQRNHQSNIHIVREQSKERSRITTSPIRQVEKVQVKKQERMTPENIKGTTFIRSSPENYANIPRNVVYHQPQSQPQPLPMKNVQVSNLSCESVPKIQYERCVTECKNWETKYNQLYLKYMNLEAGGISVHSNEQVEELKQQNWRLNQQLRQHQQKQKKMRERMEYNFQGLLQRYRESTLEQCQLLVDRFKLQEKYKK